MQWRLNSRTRRLIESALEEDHVDLDLSSAAFDTGDRSAARIVARDELVAAGLPVVDSVYGVLDTAVTWVANTDEGARVAAGANLGRLEGPTVDMLRGERTALNFLQRMCGIATKTARYVEAIGDAGIDVLDTRKTLPGYRELDKYAVRCGGGRNHRYSLSSGVIVKDNHIAAAGSVQAAVERIREVKPPTVKIEVEADNFAQVESALEAEADIILLDNMSNERMREAIERIRSTAGDRIAIEASGNIRLDRLPSLTDLDLDFVSSGALTHSVSAADVSMVFEDDSD